MTIRVSERARAIQPTLIRQITDKARPSSIHLGLGQPDVAVPDVVVDAATRAVSSGRAPYTPNLGLLETREAIAEHYGVDASQVMVTCGVQEALAVSILGTVDPGDRVLVPDPGFPAYPNLVRAAGGEPVEYRLDPAGWDIDLQDFEDRAAGAAAVIFNTPGNPTGGVHDAEMLRKAIEICEREGLTWISDEIYEDFVYESEHVSPLRFSSEGLKLGGLSKSFAMMGWRVGWIVAPSATIDALKPLHQHLVTCAAWPAQKAAVVALENHAAITRAMRDIFRERRDHFVAALNEIDFLEVEANRGAFYLLIDVAAAAGGLASGLEIAENILKEVDVVTIPGSGFGTGIDSYLRLAYTQDIKTLDEAASRLADFFERL